TSTIIRMATITATRIITTTTTTNTAMATIAMTTLRPRRLRAASGAESGGRGASAPRDDDGSRRPPAFAGRAARALAAVRLAMVSDRRAGRVGAVSSARAAGVPAVAEFSPPAARGAARRVHARQFPYRLFQRRDLPAVLQLRAVRRRHGAVCALPR